jgi:chromosome segregation ATPase
MTNQEVDAAIARHEARLEQHEERMARLDETLNRIANQQEANTDQIGRLTESLTMLGNLVATYVQGNR